jgi:N-formylglutamate deformylase
MDAQATGIGKHAAQAGRWLRFVPGPSHLVLDSPHSGTCYPDDFRPACTLQALRDAEDTHVEKLFDFAPALGVAWLEALFPRTYLDVNRSLEEIDVEMIAGCWQGPVPASAAHRAKVRLGKGLLWRCLDDGTPLYDRALEPGEVTTRIDTCWHPYQLGLAQALDAASERHGGAIHLNCHSMPAVAGPLATDHPGQRHPDFVLGDRDGTTAAPALAARVLDFLRARGHSVGLNHPYKGVELVRRHGNPAAHRHSLQLEINRALYMDESTRALHEGADALRTTLRELVALLLATDLRSV